ncbi:MAG: hypothetical protein ACF8K1_05345 [Phycisphaerales bacterium JB047]
MKEIDKAKQFVEHELKALNEKLHAGRRTSSKVNGSLEAGMTVQKYNEQLRSLNETLDLLDGLKQRLNKEED